MLILSRRANETIRFPQLGISVSIVSVKGNRVQVGIEAPREIQILRCELDSDAVEATDRRRNIMNPPGMSNHSKSNADKTKHEFKNRLNTATLGLHLAQKLLAAGQIESAEKTLTTALARLAELDSTIMKVLTTRTKKVGLEAFPSQARQSKDLGSDVSLNEDSQSIDV